MSKQGEGGSGSYPTRPTHALHRPFEDVTDSQRDIQRSLLRHQFPALVNVGGPRSHPGAALPPRAPPGMGHQLTEERFFIPATSMTSAVEEMGDDDDDDEDDAVDSATCNITSNTTTRNGMFSYSFLSSFMPLHGIPVFLYFV